MKLLKISTCVCSPVIYCIAVLAEELSSSIGCFCSFSCVSMTSPTTISTWPARSLNTAAATCSALPTHISELRHFWSAIPPPPLFFASPSPNSFPANVFHVPHPSYPYICVHIGHFVSKSKVVTCTFPATAECLYVCIILHTHTHTHTHTTKAGGEGVLSTHMNPI